MDIRAEIPRPDPVEIAERYRELALGYAEVARTLDSDDAVETTFELAQLYDQSAAVLEDHADADPDRLDELFAGSETLVSLEQRMTAGEALGFTRPAWEEIDERCDIAVDPRAPGEVESSTGVIIMASGGIITSGGRGHPVQGFPLRVLGHLSGRLLPVSSANRVGAADESTRLCRRSACGESADYGVLADRPQPASDASRRHSGTRTAPQMVSERLDVAEIVRPRVLADMAYPAELGVE